MRDIVSYKKVIEYIENKKRSLGVFEIVTELDRWPYEKYGHYITREDVEVFNAIEDNLESDKKCLRGN